MSRFVSPKRDPIAIGMLVSGQQEITPAVVVHVAGSDERQPAAAGCDDLRCPTLIGLAVVNEQLVLRVRDRGDVGQAVVEVEANGIGEA